MMQKVLTLASLVFFAALILCVAPPPGNVRAGQDEGFVEKGGELYMRNCAVCHGTNAKGNGPAAPSLKESPADLTMIQKQGEKFPTYKVMTVIEGEKLVTAHGTREMPIWGTIFRRTEGEMRQRADIYALMKYIESIQQYSQ